MTHINNQLKISYLVDLPNITNLWLTWHLSKVSYKTHFTVKNNNNWTLEANCLLKHTTVIAHGWSSFAYF